MTGSGYKIVYAELRAQKVAYRLVLNGGVGAFDVTGQEHLAGCKLNPLLVEDGPNVLELLVAPPLGRDGIDGSARIDLRVLEGEHGIDIDDARLLLEHSWTQDETPSGSLDYQCVCQLEVPTQVSHGRWAWQDAVPYSPADRPIVDALIGQIHQGFAKGSYDLLAALCKTRDEEVARALDVDPKELDEAAREIAAEWFSDPGWQMLPYDPGDVRLYPRAGGRLVEVTDSAGRPPLCGLVGGQEVRPPFTVSNLQKAGWAVVR